MSNPQCEDGYTPIANELLEALSRIRIPGESIQVFWVILRKTYGYRKKEDWIALSQFRETGIIKTHISRAITKLVDMKIVTKKGNGIKLTYRINKKYQEWEALPKKVTLPKKVICVTQKGQAALPKKVTTKEKVTKENTTKEMFPICSAWKAFVEMRKAIKKPMTEYAMKLRVNDLSKLQAQGQDPIAVLNQSIAGNWQDLYPLKAKEAPAPVINAAPITTNRDSELLKKAMARYEN